MEIQAKSKYDYETIKALTHATTYRRTAPKLVFVLLMAYSALLLAMIVLLLYIGGGDKGLIMPSFACLLIVISDCFMYWGVPKIQYKALGKLANVENTFLFCDDVIKSTSKNMEYDGEAEIKYSLIPKVVETKKHFFIFQSKREAYVVDKATIADGNMDEIRRKLKSSINGKYIIYRY